MSDVPCHQIYVLRLRLILRLVIMVTNSANVFRA